jgi:hypothetical protein
VSQPIFAVLKIMSRNIFCEVMEIFLKCLNPFKIQSKLKCSLIPEFLIQIMLGNWTSSQIESGCYWIFLPPCQVWEILDFGNLVFCIFKFELLNIWRIFVWWKKACWASPSRTVPAYIRCTDLKPTRSDIFFSSALAQTRHPEPGLRWTRTSATPR